MMHHAPRVIAVLVGLLALCALAFWARLLIGWESTFAWPTDETILKLRLVSAISAVIVGINLALCGAYLQTLLRNPLASPYILGLAAGAGLGVAAARFGWRATTGQPAPWGIDDGGAVIGALVILLLVYSLSQRKGLVDPISLLLIGVMLSAVCGALIMLIQHFSPATDTDQLIRWMMGTISQDISSRAILTLWFIGGLAAAGLIIGLLFARGLDAAVLGEDEARSVGVPLGTLRLGLFIASGILTAGAVVLAGPVGFVGLIAPHLARLTVGARHATLLLASSLIGAGLLLIADSLVRLLPSTHGLMPIGILTAAIGGPLFIWLLRRERLVRS